MWVRDGLYYYQTRFICQTCNTPDAEKLRLIAEKKFTCKAAKSGVRRTNLRSASQKMGFRDIKGLEGQGDLRHGEK